MVKRLLLTLLTLILLDGLVPGGTMVDEPQTNLKKVGFRYLTTNGIRMHIAEQGSGPLIILCHGFPESWYSWRHQIPVLAEAGYPNGFSMKYILSANQFNPAVAQHVQANAAKAGIKLDLEQMADANLFTRMRAREFDGCGVPSGSMTSHSTIAAFSQAGSGKSATGWSMQSELWPSACRVELPSKPHCGSSSSVGNVSNDSTLVLPRRFGTGSWPSSQR